MAITISGANNVDKILATDGVLDSISGFNVVGVMTAGTFDVTGKTTTGHLNIGSNIQLGNAGIITATTLVGNVTGNINATSNLLLQIGGSEKFRVASSGQLGIGGANYGSAGQVLTSGGSGSAATWSTIASDKITESNAEAEVYDVGSNTSRFTVKTEGSERLRIDSNGRVMIRTTTAGASSSDLTIGGTTGAGRIMIRSASNAGGYISFQDTTGSSVDGSIEYNHILNSYNFYFGSQERFRIHTQGMLGLSGANYGTSGQVLTSAGTGSPVSWTTIPAQATIANNADNRVITGGSGVNLNGESTMTYTSSLLKLATASSTSTDAELLHLVGGGTSNRGLKISTGRASGAAQNHGAAIYDAINSESSGYGSQHRFKIAGTDCFTIGYNGDFGFVGVNDNVPYPDTVGGNTVNTCLELGSPSGTDTASVIKFNGRDGGGNLNKCQMQWCGANNRFDITVNGNQALQIQPNKDVEVTDGDLVIGTSGHGISFSATTDGGTGTPSELLDDYEEGYFAPTIENLTSGYASGTFYNRQCRYTKVGNMVTVWGHIQFWGNGATSGSDGTEFSILGFPFEVDGVGYRGTCGGSVVAQSWKYQGSGWNNYNVDSSNVQVGINGNEQIRFFVFKHDSITGTVTQKSINGYSPNIEWCFTVRVTTYK